jgi:hypothetical protein
MRRLRFSKGPAVRSKDIIAEKGRAASQFDFLAGSCLHGIDATYPTISNAAPIASITNPTYVVLSFKPPAGVVSSSLVEGRMLASPVHG